MITAHNLNSDLELVHLPPQLAQENITKEMKLAFRDGRYRYTNISQVKHADQYPYSIPITIYNMPNSYWMI
jgi:hypothetical protein